MSATQLDGKLLKPVGRPIAKPDPEICEKLLEHVANGGTVRAFCRDKNNPSYKTIYRWLQKDSELMTRFTHMSRFLGARAIAEECLEIIDTIPPVIGEGENARYDNTIVNWNAKRCEVRLKLLAKWFPQEYGEKVGLATGDINLTINTGIPQK